MNQNRAIVVFSGGQDSTTCLFWAKEQFEEVIALTFDYGQRHCNEVDHAKAIAKELDVELIVFELDLFSRLTKNALTDENLAIESHDGEPPSTFVPGRNHLFFSIAAMVAYQRMAQHIIVGVSETDFSGYPDCRDNFIKSLNVTLNLAMDASFELHAPLMWRDKAGVWALADQLGAFDYIQDRTLTCYNGIPASGCGECPACILRNNGLNQYLAQRKEK
ncbi:7-cyano-7-deazaguanine synthase QueC [Ignatzschineria cameli]|uniref:7-cyano-7-deazaguanine synthase QueC n=1 Tax=Ignatzschineria cameli TaxID=2182793 RepID=UPI000D61FDB4|nr:7-cyano-7-deazaguanine synthase QueC [Ignatzschineria cameli]PWD87356.1 7-cyano-7-deazaguanine synthase QueC [Ignatzschineria cameli]